MLLTAEHKMSVVSAALVLVILGAFVRCSDAIKCYACVSGYGGYCDDPLHVDSRHVRKVTCLAHYDACWKGYGTAECKNSESFILHV